MPTKPKTTKKPISKATGSPRKADSASLGHNNIPISNREMIASKLGCLPDDFLVYREFDRMDDPLQKTIVAILPDGRKFKFSIDNL